MSSITFSQAKQGYLLAIGKRTGVSGVHPRRFRHTFAIQYLRIGPLSLLHQYRNIPHFAPGGIGFD